MRNRACLWSCLALLAVACQNKRDELTPIAKNIIIYNAGGSVVSGSVDPATLGARRLRLPASAAAINLSQGGQNLKWFTIQTIEDPKNEAAANADKHKLVGVPSLTATEQLELSYALPEITWQLQLNAAIVDAKKANLQLQAAITMGASEACEHCDVTLVLNNSVSVEKLAGSTFKLSSFDLYPHRNITYNLDSKSVEYSFIREWDTYNGKDEVRVLLQAKNPFSVDLNQTSCAVEANQVIIESGVVSSPSRTGELVSLGAGVDDTIFTFRSVKVTETADKKTLLPFNHRVSYDVSNRSDQEKTIRVVAQRVMGSEHRSVYHFTQPPDSTPENTLVWVLKVKPGATETVQYDFDSDVKDVEGENGFEQGG